MEHRFYDNTKIDNQKRFDEIAQTEFDNPDYNNLRNDEKFLMLASLISDDPADHLNSNFENLLESYVKFKTAMNAEEAKIAREKGEPGMKTAALQ